jgi:hypothetical protein
MRASDASRRRTALTWGLGILVPALALLVSACCRTQRRAEAPPAVMPEVAVQLLPLAGPVASSKAEVSGMAWHGDTLVLLPQYPVRLEDGTLGFLFAIQRDALLAVLDGRQPGPLTPRPIPLKAPGFEALKEKLPGWQGFEAIAFSGDRVFLAAEAQVGGAMRSYLLSGTVDPALSGLELDTSAVQVVHPPPGTDLQNQAEEALVLTEQQVLTLYEANGQALNAAPRAHAFGLDLQPHGTLAFPHVEYRITDATPPDAEGRFWAINYLYSGDRDMFVRREPLVEQYGLGPTHRRCETVERLLRFQLSPEGITRVEEPPLSLELREDCEGRNWEAIAVLEGRGVLLATDTFPKPQTLLGFVPFPAPTPP